MIKNRIRRKPRFVNYFLPMKEGLSLLLTSQKTFDTSYLLSLNDFNVKDIFTSKSIRQKWDTIEREVETLKITDKAYGVNQGDRRAIYYLLQHFAPKKVLEIGTHIGASTAYMAISLKQLQSLMPENNYHLTTVDISDVNDEKTEPWLVYGSHKSPKELIKQIDCEPLVTFKVGDSVKFLSHCTEKFDLIFLDGSHSAVNVYLEVALSLKLLNPGGVIMLHDYFPNMKPLWSNNYVLPGPFLAIDRIQKEKNKIEVQPFGTLPWSTKLNSNNSSLALVGKG